MIKRQNKVKFGPLHLTHTRLTSEQKATYELWNSLRVFFDEKIVRKALHLPAGVLPIGPKGRLIFGEGNFGKVCLARRKNKFLAVKKTKWENGLNLEDQEAHREYLFSQRLIQKNIPNVMTVEALMDADKPNGAKTLYQFMPLATLGDGLNLKKLISNLDKEERDLVIKYVTVNLLKALYKMHVHQIYHRDLKAANILVNNNTQVFISDFGSGVVNPQDDPQFGESLEVSRSVDRRYLPPEMVKLMSTLHAQPGLNYDESLDIWRLGLTLLQLCGCAKEDVGILNSMANLSSSQVRTIDDVDRNHLEEIKQNHLDKIPVELQETVFGLLEIDPEQRLNAFQALEKLSTVNFDETAIKKVFQKLTKLQIAQGIITGILQTFKKEYVTDVLKEFGKTHSKDSSEYEAKKEELNNNFKEVAARLKNEINNPEVSLHSLNKFIRNNLKKNRLPNLNRNQHNYLLARSRLKLLKKQAPLENYRKTFTALEVLKQHAQLENMARNFANNNNKAKSVDDFLTLFTKLRDFDYFIKSYPRFHSVDKTFYDSASALSRYRKHYHKFATELVSYLKNEIEDILDHIKHLNVLDLHNLKIRLQQVKEVQSHEKELFDMLAHCNISSRNARKLKELFQRVATLNPDELQPIEELSIPTFEMRDRIKPAFNKQVANKFTETKIESENQPEEHHHTSQFYKPAHFEPEVVHVQSAHLSYVREEHRLHYSRPVAYLEDYVKDKSEDVNTYVNSHGYTKEELLLINVMVKEFLAAKKTQVALRGNDRLAHFAAEAIHHANHTIQITINGVPYKDVSISHLHKLLHEKPSVETKEKSLFPPEPTTVT